MVLSYLKKLFQGGIVLKFCNSCGLENDDGPINMSLIAFSSNVTKNYNGGNTIDICIKSTRDKTITLYPVDAHLLQNKFNNTKNGPQQLHPRKMPRNADVSEYYITMEMRIIQLKNRNF